MTVADDLRAARALIDSPDKWAKGPGTWGEGRACASQALQHMGTEPPDAIARALPFRWKLWQWLRGRWSILSSTNIIRFNDNPRTTHADIMALFQRAIDAAEATNA